MVPLGSNNELVSIPASVSSGRYFINSQFLYGCLALVPAFGRINGKHRRDIEAELLIPHTEKLMDRFPAADVPLHRELIQKIVKLNERRGKPDLAARWRAKLQELDESNK